MTKSGCCWHLTEKYELVGGMPVLSASYVEDHLSDMPNVTITKWKNGKEVSKTKELYLDDSNGRAEYILNFKLQDRDKTVLLAVTGEGLSYYFLDADNKVELEYTGSFSLTKDGDRYKLLFSRPGAHYEVYSDSNNIGINVKVGKKIYNMTGLMPEKHNTLSYLWGMDVENIEVKE